MLSGVWVEARRNRGQTEWNQDAGRLERPLMLQRFCATSGSSTRPAARCREPARLETSWNVDRVAATNDRRVPSGRDVATTTARRKGNTPLLDDSTRARRGFSPRAFGARAFASRPVSGSRRPAVARRRRRRLTPPHRRAVSHRGRHKPERPIFRRPHALQDIYGMPRPEDAASGATARSPTGPPEDAGLRSPRGKPGEASGRDPPRHAGRASGTKGNPPPVAGGCAASSDAPEQRPSGRRGSHRGVGEVQQGPDGAPQHDVGVVDHVRLPAV